MGEREVKVPLAEIGYIAQGVPEEMTAMVYYPAMHGGEIAPTPEGGWPTVGFAHGARPSRELPLGEAPGWEELVDLTPVLCEGAPPEAARSSRYFTLSRGMLRRIASKGIMCFAPDLTVFSERQLNVPHPFTGKIQDAHVIGFGGAMHWLCEESEDFGDRVDRSSLGLVGHSRGAESVFGAWREGDVDVPLAVALLAPYAIELPGAVPVLVMHGRMDSGFVPTPTGYCELMPPKHGVSIELGSHFSFFDHLCFDEILRGGELMPDRTGDRDRDEELAAIQRRLARDFLAAFFERYLLDPGWPLPVAGFGIARPGEAEEGWETDVSFREMWWCER